MLSIQELKGYLVEILNGTISSFSVATLAHQLNCDISKESDSSRQQRLVQRQVLIHIIREDHSARYQELLEETDRWLNLKKESGYPCCFAGCVFRGKRHAKYVKHLKRVHFINSRFLCNYGRAKACKQSFNSIELLEKHVTETHTKTNPRSREAPVQVLPIVGSCCCPLVSCGKKHFPSLKSLMMHFNSKDHSLEKRSCIFEGCDKVFNPQEIGRNHFYKEHKSKNKMTLKPECLLVNPSVEQSLEAMDTSNDDIDDEIYQFGDHLSSESEAEDEIEKDGEENSQTEFMKVLADFVNRLSFVQMIPQTTIDVIISEFLKISLKSQESRAEKIKDKLLCHNVREEIIAEVLSINENDEMIQAQQQLSSRFKRDNFIKKHFKYIEPREIVLNPSEVKAGLAKDCYHYISILESFKLLVEDPTYIEVIEKQKEVPVIEDLISKFTDGSLMKGLDYFQENPEASPLGIYSDGVEISNPLGAAKGRHKLIQLFWVPLNVPLRYRSKVDNIFLSIIVKEKLVKRYGYKTIYKPLIDELKKLEEEGIVVEHPFRRTVKAALVVHCGDNLENVNVGGFSGSFSSHDICRTCHVQHSQLQDCIHDFTPEGSHSLWTITEYNSIISQLPNSDMGELTMETVVTDENLFNQALEPGQEQQLVVMEYTNGEDEDNDDETETDHEVENVQAGGTHGLRYDCPFNKLAAFHAVDSLPPDFMHDTLEGSVSEDLLAIIKVLIKKRFFNEAQYNAALKSLEYKKYEANDRPEAIDIKSHKLKGKAFSILCHARNFGFVLKKLNPSEEMMSESCIELYSYLDAILDVLMSPQIRKYELATFSEMVIDYLDARKLLFGQYPDCFPKAKPKHHYLTHYGSSIAKYGPALGFFTGRFESKHRVAKSLTSSAKNFINISKTLSERQQYRQCSIYYRGLYDVEDVILQGNVRSKLDLVLGPSSALEAQIVELMNDSESVLTSEIKFKGQDYCNDDVIILDSISQDDLVVGLIQGIIYSNRYSSVNFVLYKYQAFRKEKFRYFETLNFDETLHVVQAKNILDFKPLIKRGSVRKFQFATHHFVSVDI